MRIVRLLVLGVKSGIHVGDLKAAFEDSRSRIELLDQLGLDTSIREHH